MSHRVIQWSTGNVGSYALRAIVNHPQLELAGLWVHSPEKVGRDAGELVGLPPVGVTATNDVDELLALGADCACYTATADTRPGEAIDDMARLLEAGVNVVSSSVVPLVHPTSLPGQFGPQLQQAALAGGASFFTSGIDPGFANDILPLTLTGLCERWEEVRVLEIVNYATYDQPTVLFETMGFGKPMDHVPLLLMPGMLGFAWGGTVRLLAEGLGVEVEELREVHERVASEKPLQILGRNLEPGTMAALRFEVQGIVNGKPAIVVEHVTRLDDELAPEWPHGAGYRVEIKGSPNMTCDFRADDEHGDHGMGGVVVTATRLVNAIPAVCAAKPGLLSALDLPLVTGRGLGPRQAG